MRRVISVLSLAVLCLLCTACGPSRTASDSEEARDAAREEPAAVVPALTRSLPVAKALQKGEVESILVVGDSISDGNTDDGCIWSQEDRAAAGNRLILTDENGNCFYENATDGQGWVKFLRAQAEAAGASVFHNASIGGMSAKWFSLRSRIAMTLFSSCWAPTTAPPVRQGRNSGRSTERCWRICMNAAST